MKNLLIILSLFVLLPIAIGTQAQNKTDAAGQKQGAWRKLYPNGQTQYEATFRDGKPIGTMLRYHLNGELKSRQQFATADSSFVENYNAEGKLFSRGAYRGQQREGEWQYFSAADGKLMMTEQVSAGKRNGTLKEYSTGGKVVDETGYADDVRTGVRKRYYDDGALRAEQSYDSAGVLAGVCKTYYENGTLASEGTYVNGKKEGAFTFYNPDGTLDFRLLYKVGIPQLSYVPDERQRQVLEDYEHNYE